MHLKRKTSRGGHGLPFFVHEGETPDEEQGCRCHG